MNSKERVRAAVAHKPVDKVPLGFYVVDYDTIERVIGHDTYVRNKVRSQIAFWQGRRDEVVESYKRDTVEFYRRMDLCDLICSGQILTEPPAPLTLGRGPPRGRARRGGGLPPATQPA